MPEILDGKRVRDEILRECAPRVAALARRGRPPGLAVVLAGDDPASAIYVRNKVKACAELGIHSERITPAATVSSNELLSIVANLNARPEIDGILVQMPLPPQVDSRAVLLGIAPDKDVDGFHPFNVGLLVANAPGPRACTPAGIMELLRRYDISLKGRRAVVVGRSDIVGKPLALLLLHQHATVTICHSRTSNLAEECSRADILIGAMGRPAFLTRDFIREGAVVIDVGINRVADRAAAESILGSSHARMAEFDRTGSILIGDVHPVDVLERASAYTPVPGGVGPLTIAMLMVNTISAAERHLAVGAA
jgi:methylenetetrahydrofolate dehydrogenase (NADP+)/methenyltetrahydrofolate cyclohydrolase